jgi:ferredoxin/coenzyme F420-reducing hydrogenase delta subunit
MPWLPPFRRQPAAVVDLGHCNGCGYCVDDCPYQAVRLVARGDGRPFADEALVDPKLCTSCGLCVASCPVSTPFRRVGELATGIDLPHRSLKLLRDEVDAAVKACATAPRVMVFGCEQAVDVMGLRGDGVAALSLPCIGALAPSFIDYVLSRHPVAGVVLTGCRDGGCYHRLGATWTKQRIVGERDPRLRRRVPRERLAVVWAAKTEEAILRREVAAFAARVGALSGGDNAAMSARQPTEGTVA